MSMPLNLCSPIPSAATRTVHQIRKMQQKCQSCCHQRKNPWRIQETDDAYYLAISVLCVLLCAPVRLYNYGVNYVCGLLRKQYNQCTSQIMSLHGCTGFAESLQHTSGTTLKGVQILRRSCTLWGSSYFRGVQIFSTTLR